MSDPVDHPDPSPLPRSTCHEMESTVVFFIRVEVVMCFIAQGEMNDLLGMRF